MVSWWWSWCRGGGRAGVVLVSWCRVVLMCDDRFQDEMPLLTFTSWLRKGMLGLCVWHRDALMSAPLLKSEQITLNPCYKHTFLLFVFWDDDCI